MIMIIQLMIMMIIIIIIVVINIIIIIIIIIIFIVIEERVTRDPGLDQALIRACRRLVRIFLMEQADKASPSGLTYSELVRALDVSYEGVEDFQYY